MQESLKESALRYADSGFRVFPLAPNSKNKQVIKSWKNEATTDKRQVEEWWNRNPNYNIGIATGNGWLVIDVDVKHESKGLESFEKYGKTLPITAKTETPSGGFHLYYAVNQDFKNKVNLYPGIDIRSENGYIVAPPSQIDGKLYKWVNSAPIVNADENVMKFLAGLEEKQKDPFKHEEIGSIPEGSRNDTIFKLVASLQTRGLSDKAIFEAVKEENNAKCNPPLSDDELQTICKSVKDRYVKGDNSYIKPTKDLNLDVTTMEQVEEKEVEWLVKDFIPKKAITIIGGDGGVGKSFIWCNVVSGLSRGGRCFFEPMGADLSDRKPMKILFFSAEDSIEATLKSRLNKMNADMKQLITIPISDERFREIHYDSTFLEKLIEKERPNLVVFDPLQGFIPSSINMGYRNAMRNLLNPLIGHCENYDTSILIVCHTNKRENSYGRNRLADSSDVWDIARSVFIVGHTNERGLRYFSHEKCNYGALQDTVLFEIADGLVVPQGTTYKKDRDFMTAKTYERKGKSARDEAKEFILEQLQEHGGSMEAKDLNELAEAVGHSEATYKRAKSELVKNNSIKIKKESLKDGSKSHKTIISLVA